MSVAAGFQERVEALEKQSRKFKQQVAVYILTVHGPCEVTLPGTSADIRMSFHPMAPPLSLTATKRNSQMAASTIFEASDLGKRTARVSEAWSTFSRFGNETRSWAALGREWLSSFVPDTDEGEFQTVSPREKAQARAMEELEIALKSVDPSEFRPLLETVKRSIEGSASGVSNG